jgi:RHS repeat-associated protein
MSYGQGHGNVGTVVPNSCGRYFPYGGWRVTPTAGLTDQGYTGHKHNNLGSTADDLGLIFMNARYYLPSAGRFISADTIVPDPTNPQQFNRYTYVLNNPLRFTDPTGHCASSYDAEEEYESLQYCVSAVLELNRYFRETYGKDWADNMLPYITWLLENAPIEAVLVALEAWGVEAPPNNPLAPGHSASMQGCTPIHGGGYKCPPEGGWPRYRPLSEEDKAWLAKTGIKLGAGTLTGTGWSLILKKPVQAFVVNMVFRRSLVNPLIDRAYDSRGQQSQNVALSIDISSSSNPSDSSFSTAQASVHLPAGFYPQPESYYRAQPSGRGYR